MIARIGAVLRQLLVSIDQFAQVAIVGVAYITGLTSVCPSADETISSYVGRAELRGARWGKIAAAFIDCLFILLGEAPGHCLRNVETSCRGLPPQP